MACYVDGLLTSYLPTTIDFGVAGATLQFAVAAGNSMWLLPPAAFVHSGAAVAAFGGGVTLGWLEGATTVISLAADAADVTFPSGGSDDEQSGESERGSRSYEAAWYEYLAIGIAFAVAVPISTQKKKVNRDRGHDLQKQKVNLDHDRIPLKKS